MKRRPLILGCLGLIAPPLAMSQSQVTMPNRLEQLRTRLIDAAAKSPRAELAVALDEFFEGNSDKASIGANLGAKQPDLDHFYQLLRSVRARPEVQDVLVRIADFSDPASWPYTDAVYVIAKTTTKQLTSWVGPLLPTLIKSGWMYKKPVGAPELKKGMRVFTVWWD